MNLELADDLRRGPDHRLHPRRSRSPTSPGSSSRSSCSRSSLVRSRDFSTATLALIPVAIAINLAVGALIVALRLPIYLDSIGTVLVGALAGPWAGALTGILANLIWSILPVPGGAGPTIAFFAPVAGVIGLMAGFWAGRGVFRIRTDDSRVGQFLALAAGVAAAGDRPARRSEHDRHARALPRRPEPGDRQPGASSCSSAPVIAVIGIVVAWLSRPDRLQVRARGPADPVLPQRRDGDRRVRPRVRRSSACCSARAATSRRSPA